MPRRRLVPLRIPSGYAVMFNIFVEFQEGETVSADDADSYLSADILSIEQLQPTGTGWRNDPEGLLIDLSWSEPGNLEGTYVLEVTQRGPDELTMIFEDRRCARVRRAIDMTFHELLDGRGLPNLPHAWAGLG